MDRKYIERHWLNSDYSNLQSASPSSVRGNRHVHSSQSWAVHSRSNIASSTSSVYERMKSYFACSPTKTDEKKIVMEGVFHTKKKSLIGFLESIGLQPKIATINGETIIAADISQLRDWRVKKKLVRLTKKIVVNGTKRAAPPGVSNAESEPQHTSQIDASKTPNKEPPRDKPSAMHTEPSYHVQENETKYNITETWCWRHTPIFFKNSYHSVLSDSKLTFTQNYIENKLSFEGYLPDKNFQECFVQHDMLQPNLEIDAEGFEDEFCDAMASGHPSSNRTDECVVEPDAPAEEKKPGKLGLFKRFRRWVSKRKAKKKAKRRQRENELTIERLNSKLSENDGCVSCPTDRRDSIEVFDDDDSIGKLDQATSVHSQRPPDTPKKSISAEQSHRSGKQNSSGKITVDDPGNRFDSSISLPALQSPQNTKYELICEPLVTSKSLDNVTDTMKDKNEYCVVGNDAAIRFRRKTVVLEGEDTKYASILHKDKSFEAHFDCLKEIPTTEDIVSQVDRVKNRILFARALTAVSNKVPEDLPKVDLNELLWPTGDAVNGDQVEAVTKSSFYQKFVASMNIMRCTNRTDVCDQSIMTDVPVCTYAEFIPDVSPRRPRQRRKRLLRNHATFLPNEGTPEPKTSNDRFTYVPKVFKCWDPMMKMKKDDSTKERYRQKTRRRKDDRKEENILAIVLDKVMKTLSQNKKGYIKTVANN